MKDLNFSQSELTSGEYPLVAVVGRPNVGKSTLFNRMIGKRKAITDPTPGVTRDPIFERYDLDGIPVVLVDTGGYKPDMEGLDSLVVDRTMEIIQSADMVVLVMDVTEILAEDEELIEKLRPYAKKILLAVNKVDNGSREDDVWNFHSFGFDEVIPISATHGSNMMDFEERCAVFLRRVAGGKVAEAIEKGGFNDFFDAEKATIRVTILGQPNTGKSTLNNVLTGEGRSIVSDIPGTTRDLIEGGFTWKDRQFAITDTAGIRRKKRVGENIEYYSVNRAISSIKDADVVLLMIDAAKGLSEQDKKIASLVIKEGRGIILVMNKWDLLPEIANQEEAIRDRIRFLFPILSFAPVVPLSAINEEGVTHLLNVTINLFQQLTKRVDTSVLNKSLTDWLFDHQPPMQAGLKFKPKYLTQIGVNPPRFILFVNRKKGFPDEWVQYLKNRIRKDLGFSSVPLEVTLKESAQKAGARTARWENSRTKAVALSSKEDSSGSSRGGSASAGRVLKQVKSSRVVKPQGKTSRRGGDPTPSNFSDSPASTSTAPQGKKAGWAKAKRSPRAEKGKKGSDRKVGKGGTRRR